MVVAQKISHLSMNIFHIEKVMESWYYPKSEEYNGMIVLSLAKL